MNTCIIIPVYNHEEAILNVVEKLKVFAIPCFLINDGSSIRCTQVLEDCAKRESNWLALITRPENGGKGAAVIEGFKAAHEMGFTHAIQIDADGQHNIDDLPRFIEAGQQHPDGLILGQPLFDTSAPKSRLYGRRVANFWVCINTLSFAITDGMCGFRLYPMAAVNQLISTAQIGRGMDFDIDIAVRLYWQGVETINIPTAVSYPYDGVSHFRLWHDNFIISKAHASLFFGMLFRIPQLLLRNLR
jgi:glycosyltransferase involved in cell wall biosynthesis